MGRTYEQAKQGYKTGRARVDQAKQAYKTGKEAYKTGKEVIQSARKTFRKVYNSKEVQGLAKHLDKAEGIKSHGVGKFIAKARKVGRKIVRKI